MPSPLLKVIAADDGHAPQPTKRRRKDAEAEETRARFERLWLKNPERLDPAADALRAASLREDLHLLSRFVKIEGAKIVDLGCGNGAFAKILADAGADVLAVDVASNALKRVPEGLSTSREWLPFTKLEDGVYDLVLCRQVIPHMHGNYHRILMSELSRLVKRDGWVMCSTALDPDSEGALEELLNLWKTEFDLTEAVGNYHFLSLKARQFLAFPAAILPLTKSSGVRKLEVDRRKGLRRWGLQLATCPGSFYLWKLTQSVTSGLLRALKQSPTALRVLEPPSKFFWPERGLTQVSLLGKRRNLYS